MTEKTLGQGETAAEKSLEAAIASTPQWQGKTATYAPIVGGLMNGNFRVSVAGEKRRFFVKVPGAGSEKFIDREAAHAAAASAFRMGIGPEVVFFDPKTGIEAFEFLEGYRASTNADFRNEQIQSEVIDLYKAFNSGPSLPLTKTVFDMIDEHFAQARELGSHLPSDFPWLERRYEGTGLGLPLTKALVDLHRGVIGIDSARGQGTRITITFARAAPAQLLEAG